MFNKALKHYNFLLIKSREKAQKSMKVKHEKLYKTKFFKFAKAACNGSLDQEAPGPEFSKVQADTFFSTRYSRAAPIDLTQLS